MRFGLALVGLLAVLTVLYVYPAMSKAAQQLERHRTYRLSAASAAGDGESLFHEWSDKA